MSKQTWKGMPLLAPVSPVLVSCGTMDAPNLITIGWVGIINSHPARLSISVRPERYSHDLIENSGEFCVNLPTESLAKAVDWCGVKSGRDVKKFEQMHLTPCPATQVSAPLLEESPVNLECRVFQKIPLGSHDLYLADILAVNVDEALLDHTGKLCLEKAHLIGYCHGSYTKTGEPVGTFGWSVKKKTHHPRKNK